MTTNVNVFKDTEEMNFVRGVVDAVYMIISHDEGLFVGADSYSKEIIAKELINYYGITVEEALSCDTSAAVEILINNGKWWFEVE